MIPPGSRSNALAVAAVVGAAALLLTSQLFVPPIIGLANNGDFEKVMGPAGLAYRETSFDAKYLRYVVLDFAIVAPGWYESGYSSSEILLARAARSLARRFAANGLFDIRVLGALHAALLLVALGVFVAAARDLKGPARWTGTALLVLAFTDVGYAAPFNSFYSQAASLPFLMLALSAAALAIRRGRLDGGLLFAFFGAAALFVGSKPQEAIQGPLLAALAWRLAGVGWRSCWRRAAGWLAVGLCAFSFWYYRATPAASIRNVGLFHTVFLELLPHSPDPERDLAELGLDRDLLRYSGTNAYQPGSPVLDPAFGRRFFDRFGYRSLLRFYAAHPGRLLDRLRRGAPAAFRLRPWRLGNYTRESGLPPNAMTSHFSIWSDGHLKLAPAAPLWLLLFFGSNAAACLAGYRAASARERLARQGLGFLLVLAATEYGVCALADYLGDLGRHLYVFQALCDLVLIADVAWLAQALSIRAARRPAPVPG